MRNSNEQVLLNYQFTAVPTSLFMCMDNNCRSMLFTAIQLSSFYAADDGWFFRTNEDLQAETRLSENLVRATISTLHRIGVLDVRTAGKSKGKVPNYFKLNFEKMADWDKYSIEDCMKNPMFAVEMDNYKEQGWQPSYMTASVAETSTVGIPQSLPTSSQSEYNISNADNVNNIISEDSVTEQKTITNSTAFEEYKKREDYLMDELYKTKNWTDFRLFRRDINELIPTAPSAKCADKTRRRFDKIKECKYKYFKKIYSQLPYNPIIEDFYQETSCGWLGKEPIVQVENQSAIGTSQQQRQSAQEDEDIAYAKQTLLAFGCAIPDEWKTPMVNSNPICPVNSGNLDDDLPF